MTNTALDKSLWSFLPTLKKNTLYATWIDVTVIMAPHNLLNV